MNAYTAIHFILCNLGLCAVTCAFLIIRRIFAERLSPGSGYALWYLYLILLALPFLPAGVFGLSDQVSSWLFPGSNAGTEVLFTAPSHTPAVPGSGQDWMNDFYLSAESSFPAILPVIVFTVWLIGMGAGAAFTFFVLYRTRKIRENALSVTSQSDPRLWQLYNRCLQTMNVQKNVSLYTSCSIDTPLSWGLVHPCIILPRDMDLFMTDSEIRYILLHEIQHYRRKDILVNFCVCLFGIVYWFNPLIRYVFRQIQTDREIACDNEVIRQIGSGHSFAYGCTLLKYAGQSSKKTVFSTVSPLGGGDSQIKQRILRITETASAGTPRKRRAIPVFLLVCCLLAVSGPFLSMHTEASPSSEPGNQQIRNLDLDTYFEGYKGSFVLYDRNRDTYSIYNEKQSRQRISPASTFKICSALFALDADVIQPGDTDARWDGTAYPFESWEQDQDLASAMTNSVNWYFQDLDRKTGMSRLAADYRKVSYGNANISGGVSGYWMDSTLKISPLEQTVFLKDFYNNSWGFDQEDIDTVKGAMLLADSDSCRLYGKTGTSGNANRETSGWFVGFIEQPQNTWCFAVNIQNEDNAGGSRAAAIGLEILEDMGIYTIE